MVLREQFMYVFGLRQADEHLFVCYIYCVIFDAAMHKIHGVGGALSLSQDIRFFRVISAANSSENVFALRSHNKCPFELSGQILRRQLMCNIH